MQEQYSAHQLKMYSAFIQELVKKAEWVMERSMIVNQNEQFEVASLLQLRQMTDYADGVSILIEKCSNDSAVPVIRALFEVSIGLEYLLQDDYDKRACKLLFYYYKKKESELLKEKAGSKENLDLVESLIKDKNVSPETINITRNGRMVDDELKALRNTLNTSIYNELFIYYNEVKSARKKHWYSLMDGPKDFKMLVEAVGMSSRYNVSYANWSAKSHGWDIINRNLVFENGFASIIGKRNPTGSYDNTVETVQILKRALMNYVTKRVRVDIIDFGKWYIDFNKRLSEDLFRF